MLTKGYGRNKISSLISLIKLWRQIQKKKKRITKTRKDDDKNIVKNFVSDFEIPLRIQDDESQNIQRKCIMNLGNIATSII